jgi:hypothetical protein
MAVLNFGTTPADLHGIERLRVSRTRKKCKSLNGTEEENRLHPLAALDGITSVKQTLEPRIFMAGW